MFRHTVSTTLSLVVVGALTLAACGTSDDTVGEAAESAVPADPAESQPAEAEPEPPTEAAPEPSGEAANTAPADVRTDDSAAESSTDSTTSTVDTARDPTV